MNAFPPIRCLFTRPAIPSRFLRRSFHPSKSLNARRKSKKTPSPSSQTFPPFSKANKEALAEKYNPAQIAAIEAGEAAIDPADLDRQGTLRDDTMGLEYLDDLSEIHSVVDKPIRAPESNHDPNLRFKGEDELADDLVNWVRSLPEEPSGDEWTKFDENLRLTVGKEEAELNSPSSLAPELPVLPSFVQKSTDGKDDKSDISPAMRRVALQTGYTVSQIKRFRVKLLVTRKVVNQTKMGKIGSTYYLSVAGNGRGMLGFGEAKSAEGSGTREQSYLNAVKNMKAIPRYEERTIYGDVKGKVGGTELELMTRPPGMFFSVLDPHFRVSHVVLNR